MKALYVYPTHKNCRELADDLQQRRIDGVCYPARRTSSSDDEPENCWNKDADRAEGFGLPVLKSVCLACDHRTRCQTVGYLGQMREATDADVALATHKRAASSSLAELARDSSYIAVHENAIEMLRPTCRIDESELFLLHRAINRLVTDPSWLDWFGDDLKKDDDGNEVHDDEQLIQRKRLFEASVALAELLERAMADLEKADKLVAWIPPDSIKIPQRFERLLFRALCNAKAHLGSEACQFALAALSGELTSAAIIVTEKFGKRSQGPAKRKSKILFGVRGNTVPTGRTIWFGDSPANADRLGRVLGLPVSDKTPDGRVPLQKKAIQFTSDVTVKTSHDVICSILRGVLARYPDRTRVGLITHRSALKALERLEAGERSRFVETTYFHSGQDRSSNSWHEKCDLLLIVGTPRVPPQAVAEYLVQVGELEAACTEPKWDTLYWHGETEQGASVRIEARGYQDDAWRTAHRDLVRANLVQAIGRGRGILENGCDVLVFSTEECGLAIAAEPCPWMNEQMATVYQAVRELTDTKSKKYS
jgi:hypothetical protein